MSVVLVREGVSLLPPHPRTAPRSPERGTFFSKLNCILLTFVFVHHSRPSTRRSAARLRSTSEEIAPPTVTPGSPEEDLTRDIPQPPQPLKVEEVPANQQHLQLLQQTSSEGKSEAMS